MKQKYFLVFGLILTLSLMFGGMAFAETDAVNPDLLVEDEEVVPEVVLYDVVEESVVGTEEVEEVLEEELEGVEIEIPEKAPSGWGLFWRGVKERVSIAVTLDPVKKAEKQLIFAEERMAIAEKIAENTENPKAQERAEKMVEKAQDFMTRVEEKKDRWLEDGGQRAEKLFKNVTTHQVRVQKSLDRIESHIPEDKMERWEDLRGKVEEKGKNFVNALQKGNVPERVKEHLENVKQRVEEHVEAVKQYRDEKKELLEALKDGDENAKEELEVLNQERKEALTGQREAYKQKMEERKEVKGELHEAAMEGDEQAKKKLKVMNNTQQVIKKQVEHKLENKAEKLEDQVERLQGAIEDGDKIAEKRLERVEKAQERVGHQLERVEAKPLKKPIQPKPLEPANTDTDDDGLDGEDNN
jgi:hypothetical protein